MGEDNGSRSFWSNTKTVLHLAGEVVGPKSPTAKVESILVDYLTLNGIN